MKPARAIVDRDAKPDNVPDLVEIRWVETVDPKRAKRVAEILSRILDTAGTPGEVPE